MKGEVFLEAMGDIDEKYLLSAQARFAALAADGTPAQSPWASRHPLLMRVAVVFLVCSLLFGSVLALSPAARAEVLQWLEARRENGVLDLLFYGEAAEEELPPRYGLSPLPPAYTMQEEEDCWIPRHRSFSYTEEGGNTIHLLYGWMAEGVAFQYYTGVPPRAITVQGCPGTLIGQGEAGKPGYVVWMNEEEDLHFMLSAALPDAELLHLAETVTLMETGGSTP